jgi:hypothetical protein
MYIKESLQNDSALQQCSSRLQLRRLQAVKPQLASEQHYSRCTLHPAEKLIIPVNVPQGGSVQGASTTLRKTCSATLHMQSTPPQPEGDVRARRGQHHLVVRVLEHKARRLRRRHGAGVGLQQPARDPQQRALPAPTKRGLSEFVGMYESLNNASMLKTFSSIDYSMKRTHWRPAACAAGRAAPQSGSPAAPAGCKAAMWSEPCMPNTHWQVQQSTPFRAHRRCRTVKAESPAPASAADRCQRRR